MLKSPRKSRLEGTGLNIIKLYMTNSQPITYQMVKNLKQSIKIRIKTRLSTTPVLFNTDFEALARVVREEKEINGLQMGNKEVKLSQIADNMIIYLRDN